MRGCACAKQGKLSGRELERDCTLELGYLSGISSYLLVGNTSHFWPEVIAFADAVNLPILCRV